MDIVSHAVAGASVGYHFNRPLLGALFGIAPDLCLPLKRLATPTKLYDLCHSAWSLLACAALSLALSTPVPFLAVLSHITLDVATHGTQWAPRLLYPRHNRFGFGYEWEWFSPTWWFGLFLTLTWSLLWLMTA